MENSFKVFDIVALGRHKEFPGVIAAGPNPDGKYLVWYPCRNEGFWGYPADIKRLPENAKEWLALV